MIIALALSLALIASYACTAVVRRYALKRGILDVPNERSSHIEPTPRGGGAAIALGIVVAVGTLAIVGVALPEGIIGVATGATLVALIGWLDDRFGLSPGLRAAVQCVAAIVGCIPIGGLQALNIGMAVLPIGLGLGMILSILGVVWSINLFNFMDGTDGLAGSEAVFLAAVFALLALSSANIPLALFAGAVAVGNSGFLFWNWPPAKIFMGDVGSGLNGYLFAMLAILGERSGSVPLLLTAVLSSVFIVDASVTLIRRVRRGDAWHRAHREHAYQRLTRAGWSHRRVVGVVMWVNLGLAVMASLGHIFPALLLPILLSAFGFLVLLYRWVERIEPMTEKVLRPPTAQKSVYGR